MKRILFFLVFSSTAYAQTYTCQQCVLNEPTPTATATATATATPAVARVVHFAEDTEAVFHSPFMGLQTTRATKAQVSNPRAYPVTQATFRTCMSSLNPSPGVFNWSEFDNFLTAADAQGQTVQLGVIAYDPYDCSGWLRTHIPSTQVYCSTENPGRTYWAPDWNAAATKQRHREFVQAFAAKYNNDPRVDSVDLRSVGDYGEWHHSCLKVRATGAAFPMPSEDSRRAVIKDYHDFFTNKPLVHILDDVVSRQEALARGAGWRYDCAGGSNHEGPGNLYDQWMNNPDMLDNWRAARVEAEPCGSFYSTSYPLSVKVDQLLQRRISSFNTKNGLATNDAQHPEMLRLVKKMGYRIVIRKAEILPGQIQLTIENVGVAPNYRPLTLRLGNASKLVDKLLPNVLTVLSFPVDAPATLTLEMQGKAVRAANKGWNGGLVIQ